MQLFKIAVSEYLFDTAIRVIKSHAPRDSRSNALVAIALITSYMKIIFTLGNKLGYIGKAKVLNVRSYLLTVQPKVKEG